MYGDSISFLPSKHLYIFIPKLSLSQQEKHTSHTHTMVRNSTFRTDIMQWYICLNVESGLRETWDLGTNLSSGTYEILRYRKLHLNVYHLQKQMRKQQRLLGVANKAIPDTYKYLNKDISIWRFFVIIRGSNGKESVL